MNIRVNSFKHVHIQGYIYEHTIAGCGRRGLRLICTITMGLSCDHGLDIYIAQLSHRSDNETTRFFAYGLATDSIQFCAPGVLLTLCRCHCCSWMSATVVPAAVFSISLMLALAVLLLHYLSPSTPRATPLSVTLLSVLLVCPSQCSFFICFACLLLS